MNRLRRNEITYNRIIDAANRRFQNIPHRLAWGKWNTRYRENAFRLKNYYKIHQGKRCFIIGNGPSLRNMDLDVISGEYTFGFNRIYLLFDQMAFRPTYFVSVNDLVLEQFVDEIAALEMPKFINWNLRKQFPQNNLGINFIKLGVKLQDNFQQDLTAPLSSGGTVTYVAMQIAFWMGFKEVVLIGVDHSFADKGIPNQSELRTSEVDKNHFHPEYFPKGSKWQLPDLKRSEIAYHLAKKAFEADGRRIVDATIGGKLQVFPKVDFFDYIA